MNSIIGSRFNDKLTGDNNTTTHGNTIHGEGGADTISGLDGSDNLFGGSGVDKLDGGHGTDTLAGDSGNDRLTGGTEGDRFVFEGSFGDDVITDFSAGKGIKDIIEISHGSIDTFAEVISNAKQVGADVVINVGIAGTITLEDVKIGQLNADDFVFA